jgi:hypothetical protein
MVARAAIAASHIPPWLVSGWGCWVGVFPEREEVFVGGESTNASGIGIRSLEVLACRALPRATPRWANAPVQQFELKMIGKDFVLSSIPWTVLTFLDAEDASQATVRIVREATED